MRCRVLYTRFQRFALRALLARFKVTEGGAEGSIEDV